jgi:hypothetical protein
LSIVALDHPGSAPPTRSGAVVARARSHGAVLIVTDTGWVRPDLLLESRIAGYTGLSKGRAACRPCISMSGCPRVARGRASRV